MPNYKNILQQIEQFALNQCIDGVRYLREMSPSELKSLHDQLNEDLAQNPDDDMLRAKSWATLRELYYQTTNKLIRIKDIELVLPAELEFTSRDSWLYPPPIATDDGKNTYIELVMLRVASLRSPYKVCIVDENIPHDLDDRSYQWNLKDLQPCLQVLDVAPEVIKSQIKWLADDDSTDDEDNEHNWGP